MSYVAIVEDMPQELQFPMLKLLDAFQHDMREQLAVRREDIDGLRDAVTQLAAAQKRTEQRVAELAEAQKQSEARLGTALTELANAQRRTEEEVRRLSERQHKMDDQLGKLIGWHLETRYRDRAYAYFGSLLRKTQVVDLQKLEPTLEAILSDAEMEDLALLDLLIRGQVTKDPQRPEVYLALEISSVVDGGGVNRAVRRAELLRAAGYPAIPAVAGNSVTEGATKAAQNANVFLVRDGRKEFWDEAVAAVIAA